MRIIFLKEYFFNLFSTIIGLELDDEGYAENINYVIYIFNIKNIFFVYAGFEKSKKMHFNNEIHL